MRVANNPSAAVATERELEHLLRRLATHPHTVNAVLQTALARSPFAERPMRSPRGMSKPGLQRSEPDRKHDRWDRDASYKQMAFSTATGKALIRGIPVMGSDSSKLIKRVTDAPVARGLSSQLARRTPKP